MEPGFTAVPTSVLTGRLCLEMQSIGTMYSKVADMCYSTPTYCNITLAPAARGGCIINLLPYYSAVYSISIIIIILFHSSQLFFVSYLLFVFRISHCSLLLISAGCCRVDCVDFCPSFISSNKVQIARVLLVKSF